MTVLKTKGERTRHAILTRAAELATQEGLEPLSIGRLAEATEMSKSGLFAHFGSKEELQLATVDHAASLFREEVIAPARAAPKGVARVWALCDHMVDYAERQVFPGGCFFACTSAEFNNRPGPVRDRIVEMVGTWLSYLEHAVEQAQQAGELDQSLSAREIAFQLDSFAQAANAQYQMFRDERVFDEARRAVRERLESLRV
jgi:AcrR family transcriptional regulator